MITVYYARAEQMVQKTGYALCLEHLEEKRKERVLRTGNQTDQVRSLATGELLYLAVCRYPAELPAEKVISEIRKGPFGKPYFKDLPQIHFNLSHSGDYVCCAIGDEPVGVDIQKHVPVKKGLAKRFFTEKENEILEKLKESERENAFFRMWSIKESYLKLTGKGLRQRMDSFEIDQKGKCIYQSGLSVNPSAHAEAYFEEFFGLEEYSVSLCTENPQTEVIWCDAEKIMQTKNEQMCR